MWKLTFLFPREQMEDEQMKELEMLYEGKAKKVFATENPDMVIVDYKDDATAFNGLKKRNNCW